jgi:hypothetical protein
MNEALSLKAQVLQMGQTVAERAVTLVPSLLGALLLLLVGWLLARLLRAFSHRLLQWSDSALERLLGPGRAARIRLGRSAGLLGGVVFWAVMLFFIATATQLLGLDAFTAWIARLLDHLPTLLAGVLIIAGGYLLSRFAAELVLDASALPMAQRVVAGRSVQVAILAGALLVGADQMGVRVTFLAIFVGAIAAAVVGGAVIAVSLGARQHVANLIGAQQAQRQFAPGQLIRVGEIEGRILEIDDKGVLLESAQGRVSVPGHFFSVQPVVLLAARAEGLADE